MNKDLSLITKYTDDDLVIYKDGSSGYDDTFIKIMIHQY